MNARDIGRDETVGWSSCIAKCKEHLIASIESTYLTDGRIAMVWLIPQNRLTILCSPTSEWLGEIGTLARLSEFRCLFIHP